MSVEKKREIFEEWEFVMNDALAEFFDKLREDIMDSLDFSIDSLNDASIYLIQNFTPDSIKEKENMHWLDGFARYIGETFRKNLKGAKWSINLEREDEIYYGLPCITNAYKQAMPYCPHKQIMTVLIRKDASFLSKLLKQR